MKTGSSNEDKSKSKAGATDELLAASEWSYDPAVVEARYKKWLPDLAPAALAKVITYQTELIKFNKTVNLVSPSTVKTAEATHFADAVMANKIIAPLLIPNAPLYDFGSGNGIPGLVLALLNPDRQVILIDRDQRKLEFCKHIISTLKLNNARTENKDVTDLADGSVLNAVCRGFAPLANAMLTTRRVVKKGGKFFHMKGDGWAQELAQVPSQLFSFWAPSALGKYRIPETSNDMVVVLTEKIAD